MLEALVFCLSLVICVRTVEMATSWLAAICAG